MNKLTLVLVLVMTTFFVGQAQNVSTYFKDIAKGDVSSMASKFSNDMEVCVNDSQEFMSKAEAIKAVSSFLKKVKPISAKELHQGSSKSKSTQYRVGQMKSEQGNYRVFIYLEGDANNYEIVGIMFNPE